MNTRRSPRNQEILWRELGQVKPEIKHDSTSVASLERQLAACLSGRTRRMIEREIVAAKRMEAFAAATKGHDENPR